MLGQFQLFHVKRDVLFLPPGTVMGKEKQEKRLLEVLKCRNRTICVPVLNISEG